MKIAVVALAIFALANISNAQKNPNYDAGKSTIVHLFEWKFSDIAAECENFLQYHGFGAVQVNKLIFVILTLFTELCK